MSTDNLPIYAESDFLGNKGVRLVDKVVSEDLHWIFRDLRKTDLGIDAQIELVSSDGRGTGRLIGAQIKCGESFLREQTDAGYIFRGKKKHLRYWLEHSLPVIVVVCDPGSEKCYWQEVSGANTEIFKNGWKLTVPFENILNVESNYALTSIAGRPQHGDIVEALLYGFLHEKFIRRIEICTMFELPRDYHKFEYLAKIDRELVMIGLHHDQFGGVNIDDISEIVRWKKYNTEQCGATKLHIYVSSQSKKSLRFSREVKEYISSLKDVSVFPLFYERSPLLSLSELDEAGNEIQFWPD